MRHMTKKPIQVLMLLGALGLGLLLWPKPALAAEELDCRVHDTTKSNIGLGFKIAGFLFKAGPEVTFNMERGVAWDKVVQGFIARYKELCSRYNAGMVTKEEYEQRLREMEALYKEAQELERKLMEETRNRSKAAVEEMDRTLAQRKGEPSEADPIKVSLDDLNRRIDRLEPVGKPLTPKKPCSPPDMLGAPGKAC